MERDIFLVDMNAFFISCETARNPGLAGKPAAVAGDPKNRSGIILTANYEARGYGIRTTMVLHEARKLCPHLVLVPPDHAFYEYKSREVMELLARYTPVIEQNSIDEAWLDMTGCRRLSGTPGEAARHIMDSIRGELGLWCSIGISDNKFLAKMASEMKKPLGITELREADVAAQLWPLPVKAMYGIGSQTAVRLNSLGIETIGDLAGFKKDILDKKFGKHGEELYRLANGKDDDPVVPHRHDEIKSIGRSTTLPEDVTDLEQAKKVVMLLAEEVGEDARKHEKRGRTVQITIKYGDFQSITRQMSIKPTYLTRDIVAAGLTLLRRNWNPQKPVRLLGISVSGFDADYSLDQMSLFSFDAMECGTPREEKLERAMDAIRRKHGRGTLNRAVLLPDKPHTGQ